MMMDTHDLIDWLDRYGRAWMDRDPTAAVELFTPTAQYYETPFSPALDGREAIRRYWEEATRNQSDIEFSSQVLAAASEVGIAHWRAAYTRSSTGVRAELDGMFVLRFDGSGLCTELREWWHRQERS
jgi:hypothetical protein